MTMTKEPNKDFRERLIELLIDEGLEDFPYRRISTNILALCKEMLVPDKSECFECNVPYGHCCCYVRNSIRQHLLKQLGE